MKQKQYITCNEPRTTSLEVVRWAQALTQLHARIAPAFARPEPCRRALLYVQGILSETERKNGWRLAEHAREATPYGMQRLLSQAVWDVDLVRDELRSYVLEQLGNESAILALDETSFPKRGKKSAGVGIQYCGTTGLVQNCQVGVFLSYITNRGHALIDRELYLPLDWCEDRDRCREAGVPDSVRFQTKPELARRMIERLWRGEIPIRWVVADTVYGGNPDLRAFLEAHQYAYVMAVACNEPVGILTPDGQRRRLEVWEIEAFLLAQKDWHPLSISEGSKGPRLFEWAAVPILQQWEDDGQHWLLLRRSLKEAHETSYYLVFAEPGTTLEEMVKACGARWRIEEDFEASKDLGLDHYQVRSFTGWLRHVTLVMLAHAFLTGICTHSLACPTLSVAERRDRFLLPLTVPEVRHLLGRLLWPPPSSLRLVLAWSWWRRCHRSCARYFHTKRRLKTG